VLYVPIILSYANKQKSKKKSHHGDNSKEEQEVQDFSI